MTTGDEQVWSFDSNANVLQHIDLRFLFYFFRVAILLAVAHLVTTC